MKKTLLLGLACTLLHAGVSRAQETEMLPTAAPPPIPALIEDGAAPAPAVEIFSDAGRPASPRIWGDAAFLLWWTKRAPVNTPLLTQALNIIADPTSGQIGSANTAVLLGNDTYDMGTRYGGRFTLGGWFGCDQCFGVEGNYLFISPRTSTQTAGTPATPGSPFVGVPFFDVTTGEEIFVPTGIPFSDVSNDSFLRIRNELQGAEVNFVANLARRECLTVTGLVGFRYINFREDLDFGVTSQREGDFVTRLDQFHAKNNFYGGNLGLRVEYQMGRFFVEATGKVALGSMNQTIDINGATTGFTPGAKDFINVVNAPGSVFAQATNSGVHSRNVFGVVPEAEFKLGYNITRNIQGYAGYNLLYLNNVARPGAMIDHNTNPSQFGGGFTPGAPRPLVGAPAPNFSFQRSDFWAQGVTFGVQVKF